MRPTPSVEICLSGRQPPWLSDGAPALGPALARALRAARPLGVALAVSALVACGAFPGLRGSAAAPCAGPCDGMQTPRDGFLRAPDPYADRADAGPCDDGTAQAGVDAVNLARRGAGARPFVCLGPLARMASAHAGYLAKNDGAAPFDRHGEAPGSPGFTGRDLDQRAAAADLDHGAFWLTEGVGGTGDPAAVVAAHLATVYHRSGLLAPGGRYLAFAEAQGAAQQVVLEALAWIDVAGLSPVVFPGADTRGVPTAFAPGRETPDPVPGLASPGYPITVHFPRYLALLTGSEPAVQVAELELSDASGAIVPADLLTPATDAALARGDAALVPRAPLKQNSVYRATVRARYGTITIDRRWQFSTGTGEGRAP